MTDYYGVSGRAASAEIGPMSDADCDRKVALLEAAWRTFDDAAHACRPTCGSGRAAVDAVARRSSAT